MTAPTKALKILAIGSPQSEITSLVNKIKNFHEKHGPFDCCFITGNLLKEDSDGSELVGVEFPIETFFSTGTHALPPAIVAKMSQGPVCTNLIGMNMASAFTTSQGLKFAFVGGKYDQALYVPKEVEENGEAEEAAVKTETFLDPSLFNSAPVTKKDTLRLLETSLFKSFKTDPTSQSKTEMSLASARSASTALPAYAQGLDVLILGAPPPSIGLYSSVASEQKQPFVQGPPDVAEVIRRSRPRYILWDDGEGSWEREPYGWESENGQEERFTRAVKLGAMGGSVPKGTKKPKWYYAVSLPLQTSPVTPRPKDSTANPYTSGGSRGVKRQALGDQNYIFGEMQSGKKPKVGGHGPPPESYTCKICGVQGHWIQDCPEKGTAKPAGPPAEYVCKACGQPGHYIKDCPQKAERQAGQSGDKPPESYTCNACGKSGDHYFRLCPVVEERNAERQKRMDAGSSECWFCLSGKQVAKHLIVDLADYSYLALTKGALIPTAGLEKPLVPGGGHVLIVSFAHVQTMLQIPEDEALETVSEIEKMKSKLRDLYAAHGSAFVSFEVAKLAGRGGHAHIQVIPVPLAKADKVEAAFIKEGQASGVDWEADPEKALLESKSHSQGSNYFKVELPNGKKMVHLIKQKFDLQFGRRVLANLLGLQNRLDWKQCMETDAQQKADTLAFRKALYQLHPPSE